MHTYVQLEVNIHIDTDLPLVHIHSCTHLMQEYYLSHFPARMCTHAAINKTTHSISTSCISVPYRLVVY